MLCCVLCQAMFLMAWRLTKLYEEGRMSHEQASLVKAWNTLRGREVMALGREVLGGNGILSEFLVAKVGGVWRAEVDGGVVGLGTDAGYVLYSYT